MGSSSKGLILNASTIADITNGCDRVGEESRKGLRVEGEVVRVGVCVEGERLKERKLGVRG